VSVPANEGEGRVTAYASVIDMLTNDPTYVPAQYAPACQAYTRT
jgi:hypothetical protein